MGGGRPRTNVAIRTLVTNRAAANPLWGAPRIHGELLKLGVEVSERTISRLLQRPRRPSSQTRRAFLTNHVGTLVSIDFFTVPTFTGRVLFVLVVLMHQPRHWRAGDDASALPLPAVRGVQGERRSEGRRQLVLQDAGGALTVS
jgi:hypothetical protein